jgi:geranylgeranyl diphosphate synthase, type I
MTPAVRPLATPAERLEEPVATPPRTNGKRQRRSDDPSELAPVAVATVLGRYRERITEGLRQALQAARPDAEPGDPTAELVDAFYGQMEYHFGWRDTALKAASGTPGKLLRPTLLLLASELVTGRLGGSADERARAARRALPAAVAVELVHNFSLIHDDIEDGDEMRHHRATLWRVWGPAQAINTGDGMFALARLTLLDLLREDVAAATVAQLARLLDRTSLRLCEGQHLDMSFEGRRDVTVLMYLTMIERKTAALMECALEMGARLGGADDALSARLGAFGRALGLGFQLRDDLLGIWATSAVLGKAAAGDLRRRKMSLPVIHALQHASPDDRAELLAIYASSTLPNDDDVARALGILERTGAREHVGMVLREQCDRARTMLDAAAGNAAEAREAHALLATLVDFVAAEAQ